MRAEPGLALLGPPVLRRDQVALERADRVMVIADRGLRLARHAGQIGRPVIQVRGGPVPRVLARVSEELPYYRLPLADGPGRQPAPAELLPGPARQHRLQHGVLLAQQRDPADQLQPGRTHRLTSTTDHPSLLPNNGRILHQKTGPRQITRSSTRRPHPPAGIVCAAPQITARQIVHLTKFSGVPLHRPVLRRAGRRQDPVRPALRGMGHRSSPT